MKSIYVNLKFKIWWLENKISSRQCSLELDIVLHVYSRVVWRLGMKKLQSYVKINRVETCNLQGANDKYRS